MHTVEAGGINLTCSSLRKRKMLVRHSKGSALSWHKPVFSKGQHRTTAQLSPSSHHPQLFLGSYWGTWRQCRLLMRQHKAKSFGRKTPCFRTETKHRLPEVRQQQPTSGCNCLLQDFWHFPLIQLVAQWETKYHTLIQSMSRLNLSCSLSLPSFSSIF